VKFARFQPGQVIEAGPYPVSEQELVRFATSYDPQWFHTDAGAAQRGRFGGLIASGWHTCAIAMRLVADAVLHDSESFGSPGIGYIKWPHPVRPGDRLTLRATVLESRRSRGDSQLGILRWRWQLFNAEVREVLDLEVTSFFDLTASTA
jgi:acyl dehydratase